MSLEIPKNFAAGGRRGTSDIFLTFASLDMEYKEAIFRLLALQRVAGLVQEMRNIDAGERIGAFDNQTVAKTAQIERPRGIEKIQKSSLAAL